MLPAPSQSDTEILAWGKRVFNGAMVIDADGHVMEPDELYDEYLEANFRPQLEELKRQKALLRARNFFGFFQQLNTGRPLGVTKSVEPLRRAGRRPHSISRAALRIVTEQARRLVTREQFDKRGGSNPHVRGRDMAREGIDVAVLFATVVSSFCVLKTIDFEIAMIRAYDRWLGDYCSVSLAAKGRGSGPDA
jgi:hypothetical protein